MMTRTLFAALTIALSSTAFAASANSQLALSLGVEPGVYSTAELIQLRDAREDNDRAQVSFIETRAAAVSRGMPFQGVGTDTVIASYVNSLDDEDGNEENLDHFIAKANGDLAVSPETVAFAQAHLARGIEDQN